MQNLYEQDRKIPYENGIVSQWFWGRREKAKVLLEAY